MREYVKMLKETSAVVEKALKQHKTLEQMKKEKILAPWQKYSGEFINSDAFIETLENRSVTPVIPSKANRKNPRKTDFALYCERNLVERFFNKLKQYRGVATRYDKLANTFLAGILLVCVLIWLN